MRKTALAGVIGVALVACSAANVVAETGAHEAIAAAVADTARPEADTARDSDRKPAEIVEFAGVKPGMAIAEIAPGRGYYTRILAKSVGPEGKVYALMPAFFANRPGGLDGINALAAEYGNIEVVVIDYTSTELPAPADLVWTTENYHDLVNSGIEPVNNWAFKALKPGGIYFVEDHSAPGTGTSATSTIHRVDPEAVKEQVTSAGFTFEGESDVLVNPNDPMDISPREVTEGVSTKFAHRYRKPQ